MSSLARRARAPPRPTGTSRPGCPCAGAGTARSRRRGGSASACEATRDCRKLASARMLDVPPSRDRHRGRARPPRVGPLLHAVRAGGLLFCSGQIPLDPATGELVGATAAEQAGRCLENLAAVCAAAGAHARRRRAAHRLPDRHGRVRGGQRGLRRVLRVATRRRAWRSASPRSRAARRSRSTRSSRCRTDAVARKAPPPRARRSPGCARPPPDATARRARTAAPGSSIASGVRRSSPTPVTTSPSPTRRRPGGGATSCRAAPRRLRARRASPAQAHVVVGAVERAARAPVVVVAEALGQMLVERPAERDVHQLHAAADAEHREVALDRAARERDLERVALRHRPFVSGWAARRSSAGSMSAPPTRISPSSRSRTSSGSPASAGPATHQRQPAGALDRVEVLRGEQRGLLVPHAPPGALERGADADDGTRCHLGLS